MNIISQVFLYPFSLLYNAITSFRNFLYDSKTFKSTKFEFPIICIGNLSTGGTGKTPHTDYLIRLLKDEYNVAVLSRGYKRKTNGYQEVLSHSKAVDIGDEPLFYKLKHPYAKVAVCEDRVFGISALAQNDEKKYIYLLDDAYQHRAVKAGINLLITDYNNRFTKDLVLPSGRLRENKSGASRADLIVVSKSPPLLSKLEKQEIINEINPKSYQFVFFSSMKYYSLYPVFIEHSITFESNTTALIVSGIANPEPLEEELKNRFNKVYIRSFPDHHNFEIQDIESIIRTYENLEEEDKVIITTEKDLTRLLPYSDYFIKANIRIFCLPIIVHFEEEEKVRFDKAIKHYLSITLPPEIEENIEEDNSFEL